jgi:hypothetical protein
MNTAGRRPAGGGPAAPTGATSANLPASPNGRRALSSWAASVKRFWWLPDVVILSALAAVGWIAAGRYVSSSLFIFGDHPGQFMRFWYPLAVSLPKYGRILDWNPLWYTGYPELQFYPPGHVLTGLLLNALTLGRLGPERVYNLIPVLALVLPGFTAFAFMRVVLEPLGRWPARVAGVVAAWLALTFTPMWGGTNSVPIGMLGERLAFGLVPLALLGGWRLVDRPGAARLALAALALAALMLMHPFHAPAVVLATAGYALAGWVFGRARRQQAHPRPLWPWLAAWLGLALGFVAWWLVPLLAHQTPYTASLIRTNLGQTRDWLTTDPINIVAWTALPALALLWHRDLRLPATVTALVLLIPVIALGILFDAVVLFGRWSFTAFDPIRFIAEYYMALLLLTGAAAGAVTSRFLWRRPVIAAALSVLLVLKLGSYMPVFTHDLRIWTNFPVQATKDELFQHDAFKGLWNALRDDPAAGGRVIFTSYYTEVPYPDGWTVSTSIKAMTPYFTGREIVGGTFSHWSPVARLLWVGNPWARVLPERVELEDDQRLFGVAWKDMDDAQLVEKLRALNVSTIVADGHDTNARARLDASPLFERFWDNGWFYLYHLRGTVSPSWISAQGATAQLIERSPRQWTVQVDQAEPGATLTARMAVYPLWSAEAMGQKLAITPDDYAQQRVALPPGGPYTVTFTYREAWPEGLGLALTLLSLLVMALLLFPVRPMARRLGIGAHVVLDLNPIT